jgi:hypothetical protein
MRLAWSGTGLGAAAYHSWDVEPTTEGCRVVTGETQRGLVPSLLRAVLRPLLFYTQRQWLAPSHASVASGVLLSAVCATSHGLTIPADASTRSV